MAGGALDNIAPPGSATLLGWRLIEARPDEGWIRVGYEAKPDFCNPLGYVQGGFLAAMLDDTLGPAVFMRTGALPITIDLHVHYVAAARPGPIIGEANVVHIGKTIAFMEGKLVDAEGRLIACGHASARLVAAEKAIAGAP